MEYINLIRISVRPMLFPFKKGEEIWYNVVFWTAEEGEQPKPQFNTIMSKSGFESLTKYFNGVLKDSQNIKTDGVFTDRHYEKFGEWKKPEKELRYIG